MRQTRTLLTVAIAALIFVVSTLTAQAEPIDQQTARQRAAAFLNGHSAMHRKRAVKPTTLAPVDLRTSLYAFNIGDRDGFVIVSPDDRTAPVLAYSETGQLDPETMPDNMRAWFQEYANQLAYLEAPAASVPSLPSVSPSFAPLRAGGNTSSTAFSAPLRAGGGFVTASGFGDVTVTAKNPISPLLSTMWNQTNPYNLRCPIYFNDERCVTGCVATAMAQIMNYHQWPDSTVAQIPAYDCSPTFLGTLHIDSIPAGLPLDWENMTDIYQGDESDEQLEAISTLMLAAGASVKMNFKDIFNGGSGALLMDVPRALRTYFDYSPAMHYEMRGNYTIDIWEQLIYNELQAKRPVLYQGVSAGGGHSFIVDGYSEGFYHINWGWGNDNSTVYCRLTVLNPGNNSGAGASTSLDGYSYDQAAIFGLKPNGGESAYSEIYLTSSITGVNQEQISCMFANNTGTTAVFNYGIGYLDEDGSYFPLRVASPREFPSGARLTNPVSFFISGLKPGIYHLVPISKVDGQYIWRTNLNPNVDYVEAVVTEDGATFTHHAPMQNLAAKITVDGTHMTNVPHTVKVNVTNAGDEYYGRIFLNVRKLADKDATKIGEAGITVRQAESKETSFPFTDIVPDSIGRDTLLFTVTAENLDTIARLQAVFIGEGPDPVPHPDTDAIDLQTSITNESMTADSAYILGTSPRIHVKITNPTDSNYVGMIRYKLFKYNKGRPAGGHSKALNYSLRHHSVDEFDLDLFDGQFQTGLAYTMVVVMQKNGQLPNPTAPPASTGKIVVQPAFMYRADGYSLAEISLDTLVVPARAATVDLRQATNTKVIKGGNPNTLYILNEGATPPEGITRNIIRNGQADTITLADGYNFYSPMDVKAKHVRYTRTFRRGFKSATRDGWNTMTLPFAVQKVQVLKDDEVQDIDWQHTKDATGEDFWIMEFNHQDGQALVFDPVGEFHANQPYLIAVPQAVNGVGHDLTRLPITFSADNVTIEAETASATTGINYQMCGIRYFQELDSIFALDGSGHQFELRDTTIQSFRAYFAIRRMDTYDFSVNKLRIIVDANTPVDINVPAIDGEATELEDVWYTVAGQRRTTPQRKGIFIHKGKKHVVR